MSMTSPKKRRWLMAFGLLTVAVLLLFGALQLLQHQLYPRRYAKTVESCAAEFGLDPLLVYSFIRTESGFDPKAESSVGARGLMQITEETYEWLHSRLEPQTPLDFDKMYDPETNIRYGSYFVAVSLERYAGDVATAAAAYHSGWGTVDTLLAGGAHSEDGSTLAQFPYGSMRWYVEKIRRNYTRYQALYSEA